MGIRSNSYRFIRVVDVLRNTQCSAGKGLDRVMYVHLNYALMAKGDQNAR
jgi:hypothetical protein